MLTLTLVHQSAQKTTNLEDIPVEKREKVEHTQHWDHAQINLPHQLLLINGPIRNTLHKDVVTIKGSLLDVQDGVIGIHSNCNEISLDKLLISSILTLFRAHP